MQLAQLSEPILHADFQARNGGEGEARGGGTQAATAAAAGGRWETLGGGVRYPPKYKIHVGLTRREGDERGTGVLVPLILPVPSDRDRDRAVPEAGAAPMGRLGLCPVSRLCVCPLLLV